MPACWTLTTTCSPECSRATWTWAIEAEANGSSLNCANSVARRLAELGFNRGPDRGGRIGRGVGLQVCQFPRQLGADEVGPRAEHLAELDEGGAEFGERQAHTLLDFEVGDMLAVNALNSILDPREIHALDPIGQAVLGQHADDFARAVDVPFQAS